MGYFDIHWLSCSFPQHEVPFPVRLRAISGLVTLLSFLIWQQAALGHGGVAALKDACIINIGFLTAHFTIYQPLTAGDKEFCEDIPEVAKSVFVMDYIHDFLKEMPVDFRIIRDVQNFGAFVNWDDISTIEYIEKDTVFYQAPSKRPGGVLSVEHSFEDAGSYIGIVTARHPTKNKFYNAVFQFQVGGGRYPYVPIIIFLLALVQAIYWVSRGGLERFSKSQRSDPEK